MAPAAATPAMCAYAFAVVEAALDARPAPRVRLPPAEAGVFVTWSTPRRGEYALRGCIGTLSPADVAGAIAEYAACAAFRDSRFDPVRRAELPGMKCDVSLLSRFEPAAGVFDWTVGVHGIVLAFSAAGRRFSATYLPEICEQQDWSHEECIASLARKAGFKGLFSGVVRDAATVTRYQSTKAQLLYEDYLATASDASVAPAHT